MLPRRVSHPIQPANARTSATRNRLTPSPYGTRAAVDEDLRDFEQIPLDTNAAWRAGVAFRQYRRKDHDDPVLPDFLIRAQAAVLNLPHLTNDRRRIRAFTDVDFGRRRRGQPVACCPGGFHTRSNQRTRGRAQHATG
jgi:hypothetical protein